MVSLLLLILVLWVPGGLVLLVAGYRPFPAVIAAPAVSAALAGGGSILLSWVEIPWGIPGLSAVTGVGLLAAWMMRRFSGPVTDRRDLAATAPQALLVGAGILVGAAVQLAVIIPVLGQGDLPLQNRDAVFHMNAVQVILSGGNASSLGGLAAMYGTGVAPYYPAVWHALVALVATPTTVVVSSNALAVLTSVIVWPSGLALLTRAVAGPRSWAAAFAPVIAAGAVVFPPAVLLFHGQWPFGLSLALLPAALALALNASRSSWTTVVAAGVALLGSVLVHPSTVGILGVVGLALVVSRQIITAVSALRDGAVGAGVVRLVGTATGLLAVVWIGAEAFSRMGMASFDRPSSSRTVALWEAVTLRTVTPYSWVESAPNWIAVALLAIGVVAAVRRTASAWLVAVWGVFVVLSALAVGPDGPLRSLTALWYKDELRMRAILVSFAVILCALGAEQILQWLEHAWLRRRDWRVRAAGAVAVIVLLGVTTGVGHHGVRRAQWVGAGFNPAYMAAPPLADANELELIASLDEILPEDAVVVGDPLSGAVLVQAMTGRETLIPVIGNSGIGLEQNVLIERFSQIETDAEICEILDEFGAADGRGFLYWDTPEPVFLGAVPSAPGFDDVSEISGLELVAAVDDVSVWQINTCE